MRARARASRREQLDARVGSAYAQEQKQARLAEGAGRRREYIEPETERKPRSVAKMIYGYRARLRLLDNLAQVQPYNGRVYRKIARTEYRIWRLTKAATDIPRVHEAYQKALMYRENADTPDMWFEAARAYIR